MSYQKTDSETDLALINDLLAQLREIFPAWRQAFKSDEDVQGTKVQWIRGLIENGITSDEKINAGLRMARQSESPFIPSVGTFIAWCNKAQAERLNLPTIDQTITQVLDYSRTKGALDQVDIHPFSYYVYQRVSIFNLQRANAKEALALISPAYQEAHAQALKGFYFPPAPILLQQAQITQSHDSKAVGKFTPTFERDNLEVIAKRDDAKKSACADIKRLLGRTCD